MSLNANSVIRLLYLNSVTLLKKSIIAFLILIFTNKNNYDKANK